jgi:hypothetical protein
MKLTEGVDYHIREVGKSFELTSMTIGGFTAGVVELTRRSYEMNLTTASFIGSLLICSTVPKIPKVQKVKPKPKPKLTEVKSDKKVGDKKE